jgi:hypothetical protein
MEQTDYNTLKLIILFMMTYMIPTFLLTLGLIQGFAYKKKLKAQGNKLVIPVPEEVNERPAKS